MEVNGISRKIYLELDPPTVQNSASGQQRILKALAAMGYEVYMPLSALCLLYPLCEEAQWKVTVSLAWNGTIWEVVDLEAGDTHQVHYGLAVDLGSTSVAMQLVDCSKQKVLADVRCYNHQIAYGQDILTRIFYCKDQPDKREEIRQATLDSFREAMEQIQKETGIGPKQCISMVVAGNTCMIHFLLGLDAFCVFSVPYAVHADRPGFLSGSEVGLPIPGYVFIYPGKANYLGGDIISGMIATHMHEKEEISLFFDVGTNGELVVGNKDFLVCGAGAAGPALEGGCVKTGMLAVEGAVDRVDVDGDNLVLHTIGEYTPKGICGSGIVDLLSALFLKGWIDIQGVLHPERSDRITFQEEQNEYGFCYAPGLYFYQSDIQEFIRTKAAAYTMMEYVLTDVGISLEDISDFYMAGAFGAHMRKESAINIGMYPDVEREKIHGIGNTSLEGARILLLDRSKLEELDEILDLMSYIQFGGVENFLSRMVAASALPHTDLERYPTVRKRLEEYQQIRF